MIIALLWSQPHQPFMTTDGAKRVPLCGLNTCTRVSSEGGRQWLSSPVPWLSRGFFLHLQSPFVWLWVVWCPISYFIGGDGDDHPPSVRVPCPRSRVSISCSHCFGATFAASVSLVMVVAGEQEQRVGKCICNPLFAPFHIQ